MVYIAEKAKEKVNDITEFGITQKQFYKILKTGKNWSAPVIDRITNFWWKTLTEIWTALIKSMKKWIEEPESIPKCITHGRTILLPDGVDLSNERNYRTITCLSTSDKVCRGIIGKYMKRQRDRNNIWDRNKLEICEGVLGTVDQLLVHSSIMEVVRDHKTNLVIISSLMTQKEYDMVRHEYMGKSVQVAGSTRKSLESDQRTNGRMINMIGSTGQWEVSVTMWTKIKKGFYKVIIISQ